MYAFNNKMELITKAVLVHSLTDIELFSIRVNHYDYQIIRKRLEYELEKIIDILNELKKQEQIKSTSKPRNWKIQKSLNQLVDMKRILKQSIENISEMFYK